MPRLHDALQVLRRPNMPVDPSVRYPSYKSLDGLLDVDRLRALDGPISERLQRRIDDRRNGRFYTGVLRLKLFSKSKPGSQSVFLSRSDSEKYHDLNDPDLWTPSEESAEFPELMDFIRTLPFERTARMLIMFDTRGNAVTAHRDHAYTPICHEFVWFRTNLRKPFYVQDWHTGKREYVQSYTAWFDTVNQYHGADGVPGLGFSIRVDGVFTDEFRARIPKPPCNPASTPSYWACNS